MNLKEVQTIGDRLGIVVDKYDSPIPTLFNVVDKLIDRIEELEKEANEKQIESKGD